MEFLLRPIIGCSGTIAGIGFVIGFVTSLFDRDASWADRLIQSGMVSAISFVAALFLSCSDSLRHKTARRKACAALSNGEDTSDEEFLSLLPNENPELLLATRKAVANFFDVPTTKIHRTVELVDDLHVGSLEPMFRLSVVGSMITRQSQSPQPYSFSMDGIATIDDLAAAIQNVLDGFHD